MDQQNQNRSSGMNPSETTFSFQSGCDEELKPFQELSTTPLMSSTSYHYLYDPFHSFL